VKQRRNYSVICAGCKQSVADLYKTDELERGGR